MADSLTPITSDQLSKVTTAQDTDLVTLGINGNFVSMTLANLKEVLGINALNTKIDNTVVTIDQMWCVAHFVRGAGLWLDINTNRAVSIEGVDVYDNTSKWMHSYIESQSNVFGNRHFILNTNGMSLTEGYSYLVKISGKMS